jgi:hypothetical protein
MAKGTIRGIHAILSGAFEAAMRWEWTDRNPAGSRCCNWFRRLRIRWEIRDDIHEAFLSLACGIICWRRLTNLSL